MNNVKGDITMLQAILSMESLSRKVLQCNLCSLTGMVMARWICWSQVRLSSSSFNKAFACLPLHIAAGALAMRGQINANATMELRATTAAFVENIMFARRTGRVRAFFEN